MKTLNSLFVALVLCGSAPAAPLTDIVIDDTLVFPESLGASATGTLYIGSYKGIVYRALPRAAHAQAWIRPTLENGLLSILGVLPDDRRGVVWVCSVPAPNRDPAALGASALMAFDLKTGTQTLNLELPAPRSVCNDITLAKDGSAYVSDTPNGRIFRVKLGEKLLELVAEDDRLKGIDGIVFSGDGTLYANLVNKGTLWRIDLGKNGKAGSLNEIVPSEPLKGPDGFRLWHNNRFILEENAAGRVDEIVISGNHATVRVLKDGLMTPTAGIVLKNTVYAVERKIDYVQKPELKGQDPGIFKVLALPLP